MTQLLYDEEAELGLLACLLTSNTIYSQVSHYLRPSHIYSRGVAEAYESYLNLATAGRGPDYLAWSRATDKEVLKEAANSVPPQAGVLSSIKDHAGVIIEFYKRRRCYETGKRLMAESGNRAGDIDLALAQSQAHISELLVGTAGDIPTMSEAIDEMDADFAARQSGEVKSVMSGYRALDDWLGGFEAPWVVTVGARPAVGKSSFLLDIGLAGAKAGLKVGVFSLEMSRLELVYGLAAKVSGIPANVLSKPNRLTDKQLGTRRDVAARLRQLPLYIDDKGGASINYIVARAHQLVARLGKLDMILIDYIQLVESDRQHGTRNDEVGYVSRSVKALAKTLNVPIFQAAQLSRSCEARQDKRGILSDLRESGNLEADSDLVAFLYREGYYNPNTPEPNRAEVILAKNRHGPIGTKFLNWNGPATRFEDLIAATAKPRVF